MTRILGDTLPEQLGSLFSGENLEAHEGHTFLLLTSTSDGWPHLAMFSVGEVIASDSHTLYLASWPQSTATHNLSRAQQATLALVWNEAGYYLRCRANRGPDLQVSRGGDLAFFELRLEEVLEDVAPYAILTSGVTYRLKDPSDVLPRWSETVAALKERSAQMHGSGEDQRP